MRMKKYECCDHKILRGVSPDEDTTESGKNEELFALYIIMLCFERLLLKENEECVFYQPEVNSGWLIINGFILSISRSKQVYCNK